MARYSDEAPDPAILFCNDCGAVVSTRRVVEHDRFHQQLDSNMKIIRKLAEIAKLLTEGFSWVTTVAPSNSPESDAPGQSASSDGPGGSSGRTPGVSPRF